MSALREAMQVLSNALKTHVFAASDVFSLIFCLGGRIRPCCHSFLNRIIVTGQTFILMVTMQMFCFRSHVASLTVRILSLVVSIYN